MSLRADVLLNLIEVTLAEPNLAALRAQPGLAWLEPGLAAHRDALRAAMGATAGSDDRAALRAETARLDTEHDAWHRFAWRSLHAWAGHPDPAVSEPVSAAQALLYPDGLSVITVSFRRQVAATEPYAERLKHPTVAAAFAALGPAAPPVRAAAEAAVEAGRALGAALQRLAEAEVEVSLRDPEARIYDLRIAASSDYSLFLRIARSVLAGDDKATARARALIFHPFEAARAEARRQGARATSADLEALLGDSGVPEVPEITVA